MKRSRDGLCRRGRRDVVGRRRAESDREANVFRHGRHLHGRHRRRWAG